ncbi:hypothetical protein KC19_12G057700 [Ceratodon purpureus]|uniref:Secreted protein n=1 Tax=Ceratodon purpureus TaxID=3225 RepID=A0A8T0G819_CERPU|nr:hypothetical protein KC19_12G057700 [Ceratodon purpureus]
MLKPWLFEASLLVYVLNGSWGCANSSCCFFLILLSITWFHECNPCIGKLWLFCLEMEGCACHSLQGMIFVKTEGLHFFSADGDLITFYVIISSDLHQLSKFFSHFQMGFSCR